jgi:hypothetical protein
MVISTFTPLTVGDLVGLRVGALVGFSVGLSGAWDGVLDGADMVGLSLGPAVTGVPDGVPGVYGVRVG